ncbi:MAG: hypothetical protein HOP28_15920 [Gemmatimonadales bacterium]|nr:hypothetical protein [Gemmatimonadales bacterium]
MIPAVLQNATTDQRLKPAALRTLIFLASYLDWVEYREVKLDWLARRLTTDPSRAWRSLNALVTVGYLQCLKPIVGKTRVHSYRLGNPLRLPD